MLNENQGSFKELYDVYLKATYNMKIGNIDFQEGEPIAFFDKIQIGGLNEVTNYVTAHGGYGDRSHVFWETTKEIKLSFIQGVFSKTQFSILNNAQMFETEEDKPLLITTTEEVETNEYGVFETQFKPFGQFFVYDKETGQKISYWKDNYSGDLMVSLRYAPLIVTYRYNYTGGASILKIGQKYLNGFLELEGKTRVKDDTSGLITTGIIRIPKLKLLSGLSIQLGTEASPVVGFFEGVGVPVESRHNSYVIEFDFLNNDIDSDM